MKLTISPRVFAGIGNGDNKIEVKHPTGSVNFASFRRIIEGMKLGNEMPADWRIKEVCVEPDGLVFIIDTSKEKK